MCTPLKRGNDGDLRQRQRSIPIRVFHCVALRTNVSLDVIKK